MKTLCPDPIKRLVLHGVTGEYLTETGHWTGQVEEAKDFPSVFQALEFCCQCQLTDADLVLKLSGGNCEFSFPLSDCPAEEEWALQRVILFQQLPEPR